MTRPVTETQTSLPENYILAHQHCFVFLTLNLHISIQMGNGLDVFSDEITSHGIYRYKGGFVLLSVIL